MDEITSPGESLLPADLEEVFCGTRLFGRIGDRGLLADRVFSMPGRGIPGYAPAKNQRFGYNGDDWFRGRSTQTTIPLHLKQRIPSHASSNSP